MSPKLGRAIAPVLFILGTISAVIGVLAAVPLGLSVGLSLFFCGLGAIGISRIVELLTAIETDLSAIRTRLDESGLGGIADDVASIRRQLSMGVFGLLGTPKR